MLASTKVLNIAKKSLESMQRILILKSAVQMQQNRLHKFSCWSTVLMNVEISILLLAIPHYHKPIILPHLNITASLQITETKNKHNGFCLRTTIEAVNII